MYQGKESLFLHLLRFEKSNAVFVNLEAMAVVGACIMVQCLGLYD